MTQSGHTEVEHPSVMPTRSRPHTARSGHSVRLSGCRLM